MDKRCMTIDLEDGDVQKLQVDSEATFVVKGTVKRVEAKEKPEGKGKDAWGGYPANARIEVESVKVEVDNEFTKMSDDE